MAPNESEKSCGLSPELEELCTDYWNWRMADLPEFATMVGIHDYDDRLDDLSLEAHQKRYDQCQVFLKRLQDLEAKLTLHHQDVVNLKVLKAELQTYVDGFPFQGFLLPIGFSEGIQVDLERLLNIMVFQKFHDYEKLISRYQQLPRQLQQILVLMKKGVEKGITQHEITMKGVSANIWRFVVSDASDSPLMSPFTKFPNDITEEQAVELREKAKVLIEKQISPAFKELRDYVNNEYMTRPSIAATSLPNGEDRYRQLIRFHTSTNLSATEIHKMGLSEVDRIQTELKKIIKELDFNLTVSEFSAKIRDDPKFYFSNPEDLMSRIHEIVYKIIEPRLGNVFKNRPKAELQLKTSPSSDGVLGYHLAGAYDGSRPGAFYVNTQLYASMPKYELMTFCLHEANPGHHLQASYVIESPHIPFFRGVMEDRNYQLSPSRFPINTGYMEGWGLYAESLGFDLNLFDDPYDRYGHYSCEMYRACRLVVDTGLHAFDWTRERAIEFMLTNTALATKNVENEVDRYITFPGQALGYKVGEMKISELRRKAQKNLSDAFDLKNFHDIVLESVGPLHILEEEVNKWIDAGGP